jgi:Mg2+/Co2+ transporter CorC
VPQASDRVELPNLELTVIAADERRAKQVQARRLPLEAVVKD